MVPYEAVDVAARDAVTGALVARRVLPFVAFLVAFASGCVDSEAANEGGVGGVAAGGIGGDGASGRGGAEVGGAGGEAGTVAPPASCLDGFDCAPDEFCAPLQTQSCDDPGICWPSSGLSSPLVVTVCGCDGVTYTLGWISDLEPRVRVSANGACECRNNDECEPTEFCDAYICDGPGSCKPKPLTCSPAPEQTGCDGQTYASRCEANRAGIRVPVPSPCGSGHPLFRDFVQYCP